MKNAKLIEKLELVFKRIGYLTLVFVAFATIDNINNFFQIRHTLGGATIINNLSIFDFMGQIVNIMTGFTQAFFILLVSHVFALIIRGLEGNAVRGERLLKITCIGFILEGVFKVLYFIKLMGQSKYLSIEYYSGSEKVLMMASQALSLLGQLSTILYAITIYVLYRHFTRMINFESEVV